MKKIISLSQVVESAEGSHGRWEVCATADAEFNEARSELVVAVNSFVRPALAGPSEMGASLEWLPQREVVKLKVSLDDAVAAAREVFQRWVRKVRQAVPAVSTV